MDEIPMPSEDELLEVQLTLQGHHYGEHCEACGWENDRVNMLRGRATYAPARADGCPGRLAGATFPTPRRRPGGDCGRASAPHAADYPGRSLWLWRALVSAHRHRGA
jgi:hypothetical protein